MNWEFRLWTLHLHGRAAFAATVAVFVIVFVVGVLVGAAAHG